MEYVRSARSSQQRKFETENYSLLKLNILLFELESLEMDVKIS
jgi:hypothetical protein